MNQIRSVHLVISGRVQGVGYRAFTARLAKQLGVDGWVRNRHDGNVEVVISGPEQIVDKMVGELYKGPLASRVDNIIICEYTDFIQQGFNRLETN